LCFQECTAGTEIHDNGRAAFTSANDACGNGHRITLASPTFILSSDGQGSGSRLHSRSCELLGKCTTDAWDFQKDLKISKIHGNEMLGIAGTLLRSR
jgi:hypothetical protein